MADLNDMDLIREYADCNSEPAFAGLVQRHINLVYSVALRYAGNSPDAQDVTQAVFIILAKKSAGLRQRMTLTGWLYETTRFAARQLLRTRARQQAREQELDSNSPLQTCRLKCWLLKKRSSISFERASQTIFHAARALYNVPL